MKTSVVKISYDDQDKVRTQVSGPLTYTELIAGCQIVIAQCINAMGITARKSGNPLLDVRHVG